LAAGAAFEGVQEEHRIQGRCARERERDYWIQLKRGGTLLLNCSRQRSCLLPKKRGEDPDKIPAKIGVRVYCCLPFLLAFFISPKRVVFVFYPLLNTISKVLFLDVHVFISIHKC
jgi:hypothetical protein